MVEQCVVLHHDGDLITHRRFEIGDLASTRVQTTVVTLELGHRHRQRTGITQRITQLGDVLGHHQPHVVVQQRIVGHHAQIGTLLRQVVDQGQLAQLQVGQLVELGGSQLHSTNGTKLTEVRGILESLQADLQILFSRVAERDELLKAQSHRRLEQRFGHRDTF